LYLQAIRLYLRLPVESRRVANFQSLKIARQNENTKYKYNYIFLSLNVSSAYCCNGDGLLLLVVGVFVFEADVFLLQGQEKKN
jgi:hypothetical protein